MARTESRWLVRTGGYIEPDNPLGYDILIKGTNKYINFNAAVGSSGYGIRDNNGVMEFKDSGGSWASFGTGSGTPAWGDITGTLSDQTDLQSALDLKANLSSPTFTGTVTTPALNLSGATASTIAIFDGSKNLVSAALATYPSLTELSYAKGVTSAIQTQLDAKGTFTLPSLTAGSILFSDGSTIVQDNSNLFWDNTNNRFGLGTNSPSYRFDMGAAYDTTGPTFRSGLFALQPYSVDTGFMAYNAYFNSGTGAWNRIVDGYAAVMQPLRGMFFMNLVNTGSGAFTPIIPFKADFANSGTIALGGTINTTTNNYTGSSLVVRGDTGNVAIGLGNTAPSARLHVTGSSTSTITSLISLAASQTANAFVIEDSTGFDLLTHSSGSGAGSVFTIASSATKSLRFESYSADQNYFTAAGAAFRIRTSSLNAIDFFVDSSSTNKYVATFGADGGATFNPSGVANRTFYVLGNGVTLFAAESFSNRIGMFVGGSPTQKFHFGLDTGTWRVQKDATNYWDTTIDANANVTFNLVAASGTPVFNFSDPVSLGTSGVFTTGTIELGAASDTTLSRSAAGQLAVEGVDVLTISNTKTVTNKAITKRVVTTTDDATAVIDVAVTDDYQLSAIANNTTFSFTGTPTDGQEFTIRYKDAGVSKTLTWTGFVPIGITLPTATTASKWGYVKVKYNSAASAYHALATGTEA